MTDLDARLASGPPLLMDGATGTELERRGLDTHLPLWSARALIDAPKQVAAIHTNYVAAGAELLTANTFRTQRRSLARAGIGERCEELTELAVSLAREAANSSPNRIWVAGSAPTLEDCYQPDRVPDRESCAREHREHAAALQRAGVDCILIETMNSVREASAASEAAAQTGLPFFASFISWSDAKLLSGEDLREAIEAVARFEPLAVLVNCLPPSAVASCLPELRRASFPFGVYANLGGPLAGSEGKLREEDCTPSEFAAHAKSWIASGARMIGGCCGTTPDHIDAMASILSQAELTKD